MINILRVAGLLMAVSSASLIAADYVITINGISKEIDLDQNVMLELSDGTPLKLTLNQNEYLRFKGDLFSFEHASKYRANRTGLDDGIFQTTLFTPLGTTILVQEYMYVNPTSLVDLLLHELTKEEIGYGYKYNEKKVEKEVGGITLHGKQAVTTYPGEEWMRSVLAYGGKDKGVIIITLINNDNYETDSGLLERLWRSLELTSNLH